MAEWSDSFINVNGIRLHYWRTGGDGPVLVLCHGITDTGLCWTRTARAMESEFDVIMLDARGHGRSQAPDTGYTPADHAGDVAGLISALHLVRPGLVGHSMGAATVAQVAASHPDLAACAVLEDPPWRPEESQTRENRLRRAMEWEELTANRKKMTRDQLIALGRDEHPGWDDVEWEPWSEAKYQVSANVFQFIRSPITWDWKSVVAALGCPTLLVTADTEAGAIVAHETAEEVVRLQPKVQRLHVPGAGHNIRREQFDLHLQAVTDFLRKHLC